MPSLLFSTNTIFLEEGDVKDESDAYIDYLASRHTRWAEDDDEDDSEESELDEEELLFESPLDDMNP